LPEHDPKHWKLANNKNYIKYDKTETEFANLKCISIFDSLVKEQKSLKFEKKELNDFKQKLIKKFQHNSGKLT